MPSQAPLSESAPRESAEEQFAALRTTAGFDAMALAEELREGVLLVLAAHPVDSDYPAQVRASFDEAREKLSGIEGGELVIEALRPAAEAAEAAEQVAAEEDEAIERAVVGEAVAEFGPSRARTASS